MEIFEGMRQDRGERAKCVCIRTSHRGIKMPLPRIFIDSSNGATCTWYVRPRNGFGGWILTQSEASTSISVDVRLLTYQNLVAEILCDVTVLVRGK